MLRSRYARSAHLWALVERKAVLWLRATVGAETDAILASAVAFI
jgi:hypothetical protein